VKGQAIDSTFKSPLTTNDNIYAIALQDDGKLVIGGYNYYANNSNSNRIMRLNPDGSFDPTFYKPSTGFNGEVYAIAIQPLDKKIIVGGIFTEYDGKEINKIVRLNSTGTIDTSFHIGKGFDYFGDYVKTITLLENGKMLIGGEISRYNDKNCNLLIRLNNNGTLDSTFSVTQEYTGVVESLAIQQDGKILLGGNIGKSDRSSYPGLIRLTNTGALDNTFKLSSTDVHDIYSVIVVQPENKILVGGYFNKYNGIDYAHLVRLDKGGTIDPSFNIGSGFYAEHTGGIGGDAGGVHDIILQLDGKIMTAGRFTEFNKVKINGIARLNPDGSLDQNFGVCNKTNYGFGVRIYKLALQEEDGKIIAGASGFITRFIANPTTPLSQADFSYTRNGKEISFQNKSVNATIYHWDFGDFDTSTDPNPVHTYFGEGTYSVRLIASTACTTDTIVKIVNVRKDGIWTYSPEVLLARDTLAKVTIEGAPFNSQTTVLLRRQGFADVLPIRTELREEFYLDAYFNPSIVEQGKYDLVVIFSKTDSVVTANAISIQDKLGIPFGEWVSFKVSGKEKYASGVEVPRNQRLFVLLKKSNSSRVFQYLAG